MIAHKLSISNIIKHYQKKCIVNDISFEIESGTTVGLLGANGAGKTTTFYIISGIIKPERGAISLDGIDIINYPVHKRAHLGIGYLPQESSIFQNMSIAENIKAILQLRKDIDDSQKRHLLDELLTKFSLHKIANLAARKASGGEKRRTEIARILAINPKFILLDEPFTGIDPITIEEIKGFIKTLNAQNIGVLITDHNVKDTLAICDRSYIMDKGTIIAGGTTKEILQNVKARQAYLGEFFQLS